MHWSHRIICLGEISSQKFCANLPYPRARLHTGWGQVGTSSKGEWNNHENGTLKLQEKELTIYLGIKNPQFSKNNHIQSVGSFYFCGILYVSMPSYVSFLQLLLYFAIWGNQLQPLCQPAPTRHFMMTFIFKENVSKHVYFHKLNISIVSSH